MQDSYKTNFLPGYLLLSFFALFMACMALAWSWADLLASSTVKSLQYLEGKGAVPEEKYCGEIRKRLEQASTLNPLLADYDIALGRLALLDPKCTQASSDKYFKQALAKRPSSGLAWSYLAKSIAHVPADSMLFINAMTLSAVLEPYEELNQQHLIPLAIENWKQLPSGLRERIENMMKHGLHYQRNNIHFFLETATRYDWENELKPMLTQQQKNQLEKLLAQKQVYIRPETANASKLKP